MRKFFSQHPRLLMWLILAAGMVPILIWAAKDVGFTPGQWAALIISTIILAGLCAWIIGWEEEDEAQEAQDERSSPPG